MQVGCRLCERNSFLAPRSRYVSGLASPQPPLIHLSDWAAWRVSEILIQRSRGDNLSAPIGKDQLVHSQSCADVSDGNLKSSVSGLLKNGPKHQTHTQKWTFNAGNHSPKSRKPSAKRQTTRRIQENKRVLQKQGTIHKAMLNKSGTWGRDAGWKHDWLWRPNRPTKIRSREQQAWRHRQWLTNETQV